MITEPIQNHPEYPDLVAAIIKIVDMSDEMLVLAAYDESEESHTKEELSKMTRGRLVAIVVNQLLED